MNMAMRYRVNEPAVVHETFEDEVIIVNMDSGNYYSMRDSGTAMWNALAAGASLGEMIEAMAESFIGAHEEISVAIEAFVGALEREQLVVPEPTRTVSGDGRPAFVNGGKRQFTAPVIEIHSDMQDLLLLDPIHEVDLAGWPVLKPGATSERQ